MLHWFGQYCWVGSLTCFHLCLDLCLDICSPYTLSPSGSLVLTYVNHSLAITVEGISLEQIGHMKAYIRNDVDRVGSIASNDFLLRYVEKAVTKGGNVQFHFDSSATTMKNRYNQVLAVATLFSCARRCGITAKLRVRGAVQIIQFDSVLTKIIGQDYESTKEVLGSDTAMYTGGPIVCESNPVILTQCIHYQTKSYVGDCLFSGNMYGNLTWETVVPYVETKGDADYPPNEYITYVDQSDETANYWVNGSRYIKK